MSKKKNGTRKLFENMPVEPDEVHKEISDSTPLDEQHKIKSLDENEAGKPVSPDEVQKEISDSTPLDQEHEVETPDNNEMEKPIGPDVVTTPVDDSSADDVLDDVRRSLIEEEVAHEKEEQPKWWKRIGRGSRKHTSQSEAPKAVEEIHLPILDDEETQESEQNMESEAESDPIDELIDLLDKEAIPEEKPAVIEETPPEPEKVVDIEELKKQAFQPRTATGEEENLTEVRSIALEGGEEVFVEVQSTPQDPLEERLSAMENALKPYRRYINFGLAFLGLIMAVIAALVLFNLYNQSVARSTPTQAVESNLPFPTSVSLPGGWTFKLGKGSLVDGNWNPKGAEWLQGTEVCRWVALPYSRQLEAVLRTLNPDDPVNLGMSNNDTLVYKVYSIEQMSPAEMQKLDSNSPCLLIVLAEPDAESRWVLTALP